MHLRTILVIGSLCLLGTAIGIHKVTQAAALPSDCLTLPDTNRGDYIKPNPRQLPFCGYATDHFVGQAPLKRSDFQARCLSGQTAVDIFMGGYGNPQWRCTSDWARITAYHMQWHDVLAGKRNPNRVELLPGLQGFLATHPGNTYPCAPGYRLKKGAFVCVSHQ